MISNLLKFELKYHFGQASFKVAALLFFVLGYFCVVRGGFGSAEVHKNSPYVITNITALLSLFSIFSGTIFSANVVLRDAMYRMEAVVFTTSINKRTYFGVRFLGLFLAVFSLYILVIFGVFIGSFFIDADRLGSFNITYFLQPLLVFALPNVLFATATLCCTAVLTKSVRAIYVVGVLIYILYMLASIFGNSPLLATSTMKASTPDVLPLLLDPFALASFFGETRTWTDLQRNQQLFPLAGTFLFNRLLWIGITALIVVITYRFFNFRVQHERQVKIKTVKSEPVAFIPYRVLSVFPNGLGYYFGTLKTQFKLEIIFLFKNIPIIVMLLLWVFLYGVELKDQLFSGIYGIHSYPATGIIIEEMRSLKFGLILILFYSAETISREKLVNIYALIYSTPVQNSAMWMAKCGSLFLLVFTLITLNIGIGIVLQVTHGYFHIELPLYLTLYYYSALPMLLFVVLMMFVQNLSSNKYLGMILSLIMVFLISYAERFGIEHYLLRFATVPDLLHSYFNGFGYYATAFNWYMLYWIALVVIFVVLTIGMWQNMVEMKVANRFKSIVKTFKKHQWITISAFLIWISAAAFIYHQSNVIGKYQNKQAQLQWRLTYEKKYKALVNLPQPVIKSVKMKVDLYPNEGKYTIAGTYVLKNETESPVSKIWTYVSPEVTSFSVEIAGGRNNEKDQHFGQQFIDLKKPLLPHEEINMDFSIEVIRSGFTTFDKENAIVKNGTYIELEKFVPHFGYSYNFESDNKLERKKAGLPEIAMPPTYNRNYELVDLETTISTEADQKVITVGELQKEWLSGKRRYFKYKTIQPVNFMFALSSARYAVKEEKHKGVNLRIYYQAGQEYNLKSMFNAVKDVLDYGGTNFAAYPLKQFTIAEIPQYKGAATAYPGVVFSAENINFLGNYSNNVIDQSYAIAAHETAHQWWANKLSPMDGAGYAMLTEALAKYTENVLIEKRFGKMYLRKYLAYDNNLYFLNRNNSEKELPLAKTLDQPYVHYQKGGLTMYAMKELIGEKQFNLVLQQLIVDHEYPKPKATAADFVNALLKQASPEQKKFINDYFNEVVTYDLGIKVLACKALKNGKYKIDVEIIAERLSDGNKQLPDLQIDLACFNQLESEWDAKTKPVYMEKHHIKQNRTRISIIADRKPITIAVDPYGYLLDADRTDHVVVVE